MKRIMTGSMIVLIVTIMILGVNIFITPLSDWTVRITGTIMLIDLAVVSYATAKVLKPKK